MKATQLPLTCTRSAHRPQDAGCLERLNCFAQAHRLREMKFSGRNINRLVRAAAGGDAARAFLVEFGRGCYGYRIDAEWELESTLRCGPLDHAECWGRDRNPLVLIGHPYHLGGERSELLRQVEALGLDLLVSRVAGWYGHGTYHVRLSVPGALPRPTAAERFITEMNL